MAAPGIQVVVAFPYRLESAEEWTQLYHLDDTLADLTVFEFVADDLGAALAPLLSTYSHIVRYIGWKDTDHHHDYVYVPSAPVAGTFTPGTAAAQQSGDVAAWIRWNTGRRSSRGKPVYLRKYFHDVWSNGETHQDEIDDGWVTSATTFASDARTTGWSGHRIAGPDGEVPVSFDVATYLTTRTLKRRGRRPPPP